MMTLMMFYAVVALQVQRRQPGTGIDSSLHSETVHADGYFHVRCLADEMEQTADLHSDNKFDYANKANVSIIRYKDTLDREKQFPMTPKACFNFCRTVPGMLFFGLIYGRECYCTPYFKPTTAGGNGVCDLPCEGDASSTCGGNGMSDMYEMHFCDDTAEKLDEQIDKAKNATMRTEALGEHTEEAGDSMEGAANEMMTAAAEGGDMATNDMGQQAKGFTSEVVHAASAADKAAGKLTEARLAAEELVGKDFTIPEYLEDAEKAIKKLKELRKVAAEAREDARSLKEEAMAARISEEEAIDAMRLFGPVLPLAARWDWEKDLLLNVDKSHWKLAGKNGPITSNVTAEKDPISMLHREAERIRAKHETSAEMGAGPGLGVQSTCEGELAAEPLVGLSMMECAAACDNHALKSDPDYCIGFNHYNVRDEDTLCYLLKTIDEIWKYNCEYGTEWGSCDWEPKEEAYPERYSATEEWLAKPFWFDNDGEYFTCGWYEAANFCKYSDYYTTPEFEGRGAMNACCSCDENWETNPIPGFLQKSSAKNTGRKWTVQNKCMGRFTTFFQSPQKPIVNTLDRCFGMDA
jgi:hypothetical protein